MLLAFLLIFVVDTPPNSSSFAPLVSWDDISLDTGMLNGIEPPLPGSNGGARRGAARRQRASFSRFSPSLLSSPLSSTAVSWEGTLARQRHRTLTSLCRFPPSHPPGTSPASGEAHATMATEDDDGPNTPVSRVKEEGAMLL